MNLVQRVQDILLKPKDTWPVIAIEPGDAATLYKDYLIYLALVPAVAGFIGMSLFGIGAFGFSMRVPIVSGLISMVVGYVLSLVAVFVLGLIANVLAPTFGGTKDSVGALKLVAYGSTAGFLGGVFSLVPQLSILGLLASLYSIYLIFTGLPVLMKCPQEKAVPYTAVLIVCGVVAMVILGALSSVFAGGGRGMMIGGHSSAPDVAINTPGGSVSLNTAKLEDMANKMGEASKRMESAQASGDTAAAGKAAADIMGAMTGSTGAPFSSQVLKSWLPEKLGGLTRADFEVQSGAAMGMAGSSARATYTGGDQQIRLSITDIGGLGGLMGMAAWAGVTVDKESDGSIEKVYKQGKRTLREQYRKNGSQAEFTVVLENGLIVELAADNSSIDKVKQAMSDMDLAKMEGAQRPPKS